MKTKQVQRGQAIILIVLAIIGMVGLVALAVDGGNVYADRRHAQNAADAAALAAALVRANNGSSTDMNNAALGIALNNGYGYQVTTVNNPPQAGCNGQNGMYAGNNQYIQVIIRSEVNTYFASVVGVRQLHNCAEAIAHGQPSNYAPLFNGTGLVALNPSASQACMFNSNSNLNITNGGMFCNSNSPEGFWFDSNAHLYSQSGYGLVGNNYHVPQGTYDMTGGPVATSLPQYDVSRLPVVADPPAAPTCSSGGTRETVSSRTYRYNPGYYTSGITIDANTTNTFVSGVYCLQGSFNMNSNARVSGGDVTFVLGNNNLSVGSRVDLPFTSLTFFVQNGIVNLNSNGNLTANVFRFYATGTGNLVVDSNYGITSGDAYIYIARSAPVLNSNATISLTAPRTGPYAGLVYYLPISNTSQVVISSNSGMDLTGTFLAPGANLTLNSNGAGGVIDAQIIVDRFLVNSNADLTLNFNPDVVFGGAVPPTIELVR